MTCERHPGPALFHDMIVTLASMAFSHQHPVHLGHSAVDVVCPIVSEPGLCFLAQIFLDIAVHYTILQVM